jgi:NhaA family Na+:H+ antiporter
MMRGREAALLISRLQQFFKLDIATGVVLVAAAVLALILANSLLAPMYGQFLDLPVVLQVGSLKLAKPLLLWVNDGLMAVFFMLVGLEVKREVIEGDLSRLSVAALPAIAAIGGMVGPALIYLLCNITDPQAMRGWAIPTATDIAFALGVLALLGSRVPSSLKTFLLALAIIDDLGAIIIIAAFYTSDLSVMALELAGVGVAVLIAFNLMGVTRRAAYILVGIFLWVCVLKSGIHATLAGVIVGLAIPLRAKDGGSPLHSLEHDLSPWVNFGVLPIFAFTNAGVRLLDIGLADLVHPVQLGIGLGLLVGKQCGVMGSVWLALRLRLGALPDQVSWRQMYGVALLTGIGFTMSLFIATLAFPAEAYDADVRVMVLFASVISAVCGYVVLFRASR